MKQRSSNLELLRIVAMLMIVAYHIYDHCIGIQLTDPSWISKLGNEWVCVPRFSKKLCLLALIQPMGLTGNAIFFLISGYFTADKPSVDLTKISKKLIFQLAFAAIVLGAVSIYAYRNGTDFPLKPVQFGAFNWMSWYVGYFFIVMVIAKVFLNSFLAKLSAKNYVMFMAALFAIVQFSWSRGVISNLSNGLETVCIGVFLYSFGGYVRKYDPFKSVRLWVIFAAVITINLIVLGNFYISTANNILEFNQNGGSTFIQSIPCYENYQIIPVTLGIALFELFRRIKAPNNPAINFIGASTFMVYLIHDNRLFYEIWKTQNWLSVLHETPLYFVVKYFVWTVATFAVGVLCYCLFLLLSKLLGYCKPLIMKHDENTAEKQIVS